MFYWPVHWGTSNAWGPTPDEITYRFLLRVSGCNGQPLESFVHGETTNYRVRRSVCAAANGRYTCDGNPIWARNVAQLTLSLCHAVNARQWRDSVDIGRRELSPLTSTTQVKRKRVAAGHRVASKTLHTSPPTPRFMVNL